MERVQSTIRGSTTCRRWVVPWQVSRWVQQEYLPFICSFFATYVAVFWIRSNPLQALGFPSDFMFLLKWGFTLIWIKFIGIKDLLSFWGLISLEVVYFNWWFPYFVLLAKPKHWFILERIRFLREFLSIEMLSMSFIHSTAYLTRKISEA